MIVENGDPACYCRGTMILTDKGQVAVESLAIGDMVVTAAGAAKAVRWLGIRAVSSRFADPVRAYPVRVRANAIDDNVPARDLLVSPDHALLIDGNLIQAGALVNGTSIVREKNVPETFNYYHVELAEHDLILAENAPAETFVDNVSDRSWDSIIGPSMKRSIRKANRWSRCPIPGQKRTGKSRKPPRSG